MAAFETILHAELLNIAPHPPSTTVEEEKWTAATDAIIAAHDEDLVDTLTGELGHWIEAWSDIEGVDGGRLDMTPAELSLLVVGQLQKRINDLNKARMS